MVIVTRLEEGGCSVSVIAEGSVFFQALVRDEQAVEQVLWNQLRLRGIAFEPVHTRSYAASPFRRKPKSTQQVRRPGLLALLFSLAMLLLRVISVVECRPEPVRKAHRWSPEQVLQWLHFLTRQVLERQYPVFCVEDLQSTWLTGPYRHLYRWSLRFVVGGSSTLLFGQGSAFFVSQVAGRLGSAPLFGMLCGLLFGVLCGLLFRQGKGLRPEEVITWNRSVSKGALALILFSGLVTGFGGGQIASNAFGGDERLGLILSPAFASLLGVPIGLFSPCCWDNNLIERSPLAPTEYAQ